MGAPIAKLMVNTEDTMTALSTPSNASRETQRSQTRNAPDTVSAAKKTDALEKSRAEQNTVAEGASSAGSAAAVAAAKPASPEAVKATRELVSAKEVAAKSRVADVRAGDDRTGPRGALADAKDMQPGILQKLQNLKNVRTDKINPNPDSRLGAYKATLGYPPGTVGNAVNGAIASIYGTFGTFGEERIGSVFNSPEAKALYNQPVTSDASKKIAEMEHSYWSKVRSEDPWSPGGNMGSAFTPTVRDWLQKNIFSEATTPRRGITDEMGAHAMA